MAPPGIVLSQPTSTASASNMCPRATSSIESAVTSRETGEVFMPSVPMVMPSLIAMVLNSMGVPPASRTPRFTCSARRRRLKLHGMVSVQVLAMPTIGRVRSASEKPIAFRYERAGARSRPSRRVRLLWRGSSDMAAHGSAVPPPREGPDACSSGGKSRLSAPAVAGISRRPRNGRGQSHVGPLHISAPSARRLLRRAGILSRSQAPLEPGGEALRGQATLSAGPLPLVLRHLRASPAPVCVFWRLRALPCPFGLVLPRSDQPVQASSGSPADRRVRVSLPVGHRSALARASLLRGSVGRRLDRALRAHALLPRSSAQGHRVHRGVSPACPAAADESRRGAFSGAGRKTVRSLPGRLPLPEPADRLPLFSHRGSDGAARGRATDPCRRGPAGQLHAAPERHLDVDQARRGVLRDPGDLALPARLAETGPASHDARVRHPLGGSTRALLGRAICSLPRPALLDRRVPDADGEMARAGLHLSLQRRAPRARARR